MKPTCQGQEGNKKINISFMKFAGAKQREMVRSRGGGRGSGRRRLAISLHGLVYIYSIIVVVVSVIRT